MIKEIGKILNVLIFLIILYVPLYLLSKKLYILASFYFIIIGLWRLWIKRKSNVQLNDLAIEWRKLIGLDYYYITDDHKKIDLDIRRNVLSEFSNTMHSILLTLIIFILGMYFLLKHFHGVSVYLNLLLFLSSSVIVIILFAGIIAEIVFKYTTTIYVSIPIISAIIYFQFIDPVISFFPDFTRFGFYICTTAIMYFILAFTFPVHILRNLNGKTVLISSVTTIVAAFSSQIIVYLYSNYFKSKFFLLSIESIKKEANISEPLKNIILENPDLIDLINDLLVKEASSQLNSMASLVITSFAISYIIGGLLINRKISNGRVKAKSIYRKIMKEEIPLNYQTLIECSYYGGEDYENLLLNNNVTSKIIMNNEANLNIPDISIKTRFKAWLKRNLTSYSIFTEMMKKK
ncbi:hypothetical protein [Bacillus pumilus]|uniref:hypothetical protein n=1 Tax=Bacillus pumilus TaxID=1408 RepID=UPI000DCA606B|nr:hypothetical protein [Bacillus pumilus]RAU04278.1 hypothetical protein DEJ55_11390 [Bacillus pumilus]